MLTEGGPSFWQTTTPSKPRPALCGRYTTDVAIIGAGFLGLSTAATLAEGGRSAVVLEAATVGYSASGRNAGFVVPNFSKADPAVVVTALGKEKGERLLKLVASGGSRVFALARQAGLGDQAEQTGWLQPAHSPAAARAARTRVEAWQSLGHAVEWLDAQETKRRTGIDIYHGALSDASGGVINPMAHAQAFAGRAEAAGAVIFEQSLACSVDREGKGWLVQTAAGSVQARFVLLCTNAHETGVAHNLGKTVIPLRVFQIATEPLATDVIGRFSPWREPVSDTRSNIFTYRLTADNRLISGGMAKLPMGAESRMGTRIASRLAQELDLHDVPRVDFSWHGTAAVTTDFLPHIITFGSGFAGVTACNGRGVATTPVLGEMLGEALLKQRPLSDLPLPVKRLKPVPVRFIAQWAPYAFLLKGDITDRWAIWKTRRDRSKLSDTQPPHGEWK